VSAALVVEKRFRRVYQVDFALAAELGTLEPAFGDGRVDRLLEVVGEEVVSLLPFVLAVLPVGRWISDDELLDRIEANLKLGLQRLPFDIGDVWSHLRQHQVDQLRAVGAFDHVGVIDVELGVVVEEIPLLEVVSVGVVDDPVEVVVPRAVDERVQARLADYIDLAWRDIDILLLEAGVAVTTKPSVGMCGRSPIVSKSSSRRSWK